MELKEAELKIFVDAVTQYFEVTTGTPATIRSAYLADTDTASFDYTGLITFSGAFLGCVYFSAPGAMLRGLLQACAEPDTRDANLLDAAGEIANTIAGNARRHFGKALEISVPVTMRGPAERIKAAVRVRPFVISLRWRQYEGVVVVDLEPAD